MDFDGVNQRGMNHEPMVLNADLIEHIETTPDTVISLTNGQKYLVLDSASDSVDKVIAYRREILFGGAPTMI